MAFVVDTAYLAATDGLVVCYATADTEDVVSTLIGKTDSSNPPTTAVAGCTVSKYYDYSDRKYDYTTVGSFCMPVIKGEYFKIAQAYTVGSSGTTVVIRWIPMGS